MSPKAAMDETLGMPLMASRSHHGPPAIGPVHSDASFTARHLVSKVRGRFRDLNGQIRTSENPLGSSVTITIGAASVDTGNTQRDEHLRSADAPPAPRGKTCQPG